MMTDKSFVFTFDDVEVREREFSITKGGRALALEPKAFRALLFLLHNPQKLISKDELLNSVWGNTAVTEASLTRSIWLVRNVLGDDTRNPRYIETVPTVGYRFIAPVVERIEPSGSEIAEVVAGVSSPRTPDGGPRTRTPSRRWIWVGLTAVTLLAVVAVWGVRHRSLAPRIRSVTVLPLHNLSSGPNTEYFADGMTEELISDLSAIPELKVVSDSSTAPVKDSPESLTETAHKLGVDAVVQGSVLRSSDKISVDIRLFDARSDRQLWAGRFEDTPGNASALQKHIAAEIAARGRVLLTPSQQATLDDTKPLDPSAYDGYLQGRYLLGKRDAEGAVKMFRRAVVLDPKYARSWAGLAAGLADSGPEPGQEDPMAEAKAAAQHAIELDPENGEAWSALGQIAFKHDWDWKTAEYDLRRATELSPSDPTIHVSCAIFLSIVGRHDEAVSHMRRALELDPLSFLTVRMMSSVLFWSRRYDESLTYIRKAEEMEPDLLDFTIEWEVDNYTMKGMGEQAAMADLRNFAYPDLKSWQVRLAAAYRSGGRKAYWEQRIKFDKSNPDSTCRGVQIAKDSVLHRRERSGTGRVEPVDGHALRLARNGENGTHL